LTSKEFSDYPHTLLQVGIYARARARAARGYKTYFWPGVRVRVILILNLVILDHKTIRKLVIDTWNLYLFYLWTY